MTQQSFTTFFDSQLNSAQQQAVKHAVGPLLVIAGAGSGKTRVITARIVHLISQQGVLPTAIVALTFTNKAAQEMRARITKFLANTPVLPFIGTFHSYCLQLLKMNAQFLPFSPFTIMDADDQLKLIGSIVNRMHMGKKVSAKQVAYHISNLKNNALEKHADPLVRKVFEQYEAEKKASHCFDFDDLLLETLRIFKKHPEFKAQFQERVRHILVDEYQDTNITQHELLKEMALHKKKFAIDSLCAVGDEDQSIYSWRGATVENMLNFKKDFTPTTTVTIDQNYRSVQPILDSANHVIKNNYKRNPKNLWSTKKGTDRIRLLTAMSGFQEAEIVAHALRTLQANKIPLTQVAILYRAHYQSRLLEEALIKNSIAYKIIGGIQFYERAEVKDLLAYLKLLTNPFDRVSFFRVVNTPARGLGEKFEEQVYDKWSRATASIEDNVELFDADPFNDRPLPFHEICKQMLAGSELTKTKKAGLASFLAVFDGLTHQSAPLATLEHIIKTTHYAEYIKNNHDAEEAQTKLENIKELLSAVGHFQTQGLTTIEAFLNEVTLMQEKTNAKDDKHERVQLMTLHAAKGLEFNTVIITSLEEGILPSGHSIGGDGDIEEERRLMYVGITRAEERLLLTNARFRSMYGQLDMKRPSRFVEEIPQNFIRADDCSNWHAPQFARYFSQWLGGVAPTQQESTVYVPAYTAKTTTQVAAPTVVNRAAKRAHDPEQENATTSSPGAWKKNQPVKHATFGIGIIQMIEKKSPTLIHITAQFKVGVKKIDAKFLQPV